MEIRKIREEELVEARNISSVCFEWSHDTEGKTPEEYARNMREKASSKADAYLEETWAAFADGGEMAAAMSVIPYQIYFDGNIVPMRGIGGVCTYPQFRRHGAIRRIFNEILPLMYQEGVLFSYLYPFSEAFYRKFGYERSAWFRRWDLELREIPDYDYSSRGKIRLCRGEAEFPALYEAYKAFAGKQNMAVERDALDWAMFKDTDPFKKNRFLYYYERTTEAGGVECGGYFVFEQLNEKGIPIMDCKEFVFRDPEGLRALLAFARGFSGHFQMLRAALPLSCPLEYYTPDYAQSASRGDYFGNRGMVRAVNVEAILKAASYRGDGALTIRVSDQQIKENDAVFQVSFSAGKADKVERLEPGAVVDIALPVNLFAAAITGSLPAEELEFRPDVELSCEPEKASGVFYRKSTWINNYF